MRSLLSSRQTRAYTSALWFCECLLIIASPTADIDLGEVTGTQAFLGAEHPLTPVDSDEVPSETSRDAWAYYGL